MAKDDDGIVDQRRILFQQAQHLGRGRLHQALELVDRGIRVRSCRQQGRECLVHSRRRDLPDLGQVLLGQVSVAKLQFWANRGCGLFQVSQYSMNSKFSGVNLAERGRALWNVPQTPRAPFTGALDQLVSKRLSGLSGLAYRPSLRRAIPPKPSTPVPSSRKLLGSGTLWPLFSVTETLSSAR